MLPNPKLNPKFFILEDEDEIKKSDEYYNPCTDKWLPVEKDFIGNAFNAEESKPVRRKNTQHREVINSESKNNTKMKFHLTLDNTTSVCGKQINRPDTFLYNTTGFTTHLAAQYRCKLCEKILNATKSPV